VCRTARASDDLARGSFDLGHAVLSPLCKLLEDVSRIAPGAAVADPVHARSGRTPCKRRPTRDVWATLHSAVSRPFAKPKSGRIALKLINYYGEEVLKIYR